MHTHTESTHTQSVHPTRTHTQRAATLHADTHRHIAHVHTHREQQHTTRTVSGQALLSELAAWRYVYHGIGARFHREQYLTQHRVWHPKLLSKLPYFGIPPNLCLLIKSLLSHRSISVRVDGHWPYIAFCSY